MTPRERNSSSVNRPVYISCKRSTDTQHNLRTRASLSLPRLFKSLLFSSRSSTTDQPLHHLVHQQLLLCSGQHEEVMRLLNNHGPQSVHHVSGELLDGAHPRTAK